MSMNGATCLHYTYLLLKGWKVVLFFFPNFLRLLAFEAIDRNLKSLYSYFLSN